jgi:hypothetical protein
MLSEFSPSGIKPGAGQVPPHRVFMLPPRSERGPSTRRAASCSSGVAPPSASSSDCSSNPAIMSSRRPSLSASDGGSASANQSPASVKPVAAGVELAFRGAMPRRPSSGYKPGLARGKHREFYKRFRPAQLVRGCQGRSHIRLVSSGAGMHRKSRGRAAGARPTLVQGTGRSRRSRIEWRGDVAGA